MRDLRIGKGKRSDKGYIVDRWWLWLVMALNAITIVANIIEVR